MKRVELNNEPSTFESIGLAALLILNKLRVKAQLELGDEQKIHGNRDAGRDTANECDRTADKKEIERRLAELREMEDKLAEAPKRHAGERRADNLVRR